MRIPVATCFALFAMAQASPPRDETADRRVVVELTTPRDSYFVGETFTLHVIIRAEREFARTNLVPIFRQPLDFAAQLVAPWIDDLPGTLALDSASPQPCQSLALNDGLASATILPDPDHVVLELARLYVATRPGVLTVPETILRFAYATRFEDDFVAGPVAADRIEAFVRGAPLALTITPLPEAGRPPEFSGAVGQFSCWTKAEPSVVELGQSIKLILRIEGDGDLAHFDPPRMEDLDDFELHGIIDDKAAARRTITYDLAPRSADVTRVPPVAFAFFDPRPPGEYRVVHTSPIPIVVQAAAVEISRPTPPAPVRSSSRVGWVLAVLGVVVIALVIRSRRNT